MANPFELLGLPEDATEAQVKEAWREQARLLHPDLGGDPEVFQKTHEAYTQALSRVSSRPCPTCEGRGFVQHVHGFYSLKMVCPTCQVPKK